MAWRTVRLPEGTALVLLALAASARAVDQTPSAILADLDAARAAVRVRAGAELALNTEDVDVVASLLTALRQEPLSPETLRREVRLWGAVVGEIRRRQYNEAYWGRPKEHNRRYSHSVYLPAERGGWIESDDFDLIEHLITKPLGKASIDVRLRLHFLD